MLKDELMKTASAGDNYTFGGRYENDELISTQATITFTAEEDRESEAEFTEVSENITFYTKSSRPHIAERIGRPETVTDNAGQE